MKEIHDLFGYYATYMEEEDFRFVIYSIMNIMINDDNAYGDKYTMPNGFIEECFPYKRTEKNKGFDFIEVFVY
ncbi:hypothetical protein [Faecalibacillus intestinalis]|uniref:hypothetical protein n=1 Tax=Faecalibacillus intestinalis TaxID=1982626 RepID=UPI00399476B2